MPWLHCFNKIWYQIICQENSISVHQTAGDWFHSYFQALEISLNNISNKLRQSERNVEKDSSTLSPKGITKIVQSQQKDSTLCHSNEEIRINKSTSDHIIMVEHEINNSAPDDYTYDVTAESDIWQWTLYSTNKPYIEESTYSHNILDSVDSKTSNKPFSGNHASLVNCFDDLDDDNASCRSIPKRKGVGQQKSKKIVPTKYSIKYMTNAIGDLSDPVMQST